MGKNIRKFEAFVGDDGELQGFDSDSYQDENYPKDLGYIYCRNYVLELQICLALKTNRVFFK